MSVGNCNEMAPPGTSKPDAWLFDRQQRVNQKSLICKIQQASKYQAIALVL